MGDSTRIVEPSMHDLGVFEHVGHAVHDLTFGLVMGGLVALSTTVYGTASRSRLSQNQTPIERAGWQMGELNLVEASFF